MSLTKEKYAAGDPREKKEDIVSLRNTEGRQHTLKGRLFALFQTSGSLEFCFSLRKKKSLNSVKVVALTPSIKIKIKINKDSIKWKLYSLEDHFSDQSCNTAIFKYTHTNSNLLQEDDLKLTDRTSGYEKSILGLPWWLSGKESALQCRRHGSNP